MSRADTSASVHLAPWHAGMQSVSPACDLRKNSQSSVYYTPVLPSAGPFLRNIHHGKMQHFQQAVIRWEHGF